MVKGRVWKFGDNIDTDQIYPNQYLPLTDDMEIAKHAMEGVDPDFTAKVNPGDILIVGTNFGCGSSREQAPQALKLSGISLVIARSFARIFYRNAINIALPILEFERIEQIEEGDELEVDLESGEILDSVKNKRYLAKPMSGLELDILRAGGLINYLKDKNTQLTGE